MRGRIWDKTDKADKIDKADEMDKAVLVLKRLSQKTEILNAKCAKDLREERKVLVLKDLFFANFAKNLCAFALKRLLRQPPWMENGIAKKSPSGGWG